MKKKYLLIFLSLIMALGLGACSNNKDSKEITIKTVTDLITRLDNYQKVKEEEKRLAEEEKKQKTSKKSIQEIEKEEIEAKAKKELAERAKKKPVIKKVKLKAFGDIMAHIAQIQYAHNKGGGEYDFSDQFTYIKDFVKDADISIGNFETTSNPNLPYAGFPRFNVPEAYLKNLKDIGFDIVTTANNHSMDTELEGVMTTMDAVKKAGLDYVGSFKNKSERILLKEVNGIKIAFLAYTYGCNGRENLIVPREEVENLCYL